MRASTRNVSTMDLRRIISLGLLFILYSLFISPIGAQAQVKFGVKGGLQLINMDFNRDALKESNRAGFFVGPTLKIGLPVPGLSIDAAALYDQRDLKVEGRTFKQKSLLLQGDARYTVGLGDLLGIFFLAGPQFSFNVGDDVWSWVTDKGDTNQFSLQETLLSFNLGLGVVFAKHFEGSIHYNIPISKTADFTWQELGDKLLDQTWKHATSSTNSWSVGVTYFF